MPEKGSTSGKAPAYFRFMEQVQAEYVASGAKALLEGKRAGRNIDVFVEYTMPDGNEMRIAVECKHYARKVGVKAVEEFANMIYNMRASGHVDKGTIVSLSGFSSDAQTTAATHHIRLVTFEELRWRLSALYAYVDDALRNEVESGSDFIPVSAISLANEAVDDVIEFLGEWVRGPLPQTFLSGQGGSGKTTVSKQFMRAVAGAYLAGEVLAAPVYVDMGGVAESDSIVDVVKSQLDGARVGLDKARVEELIRRGRICLIVDGYDEYALGKAGAQRRKGFGDLDSCLTDESKIMITCRSTFFRSQGEMVAHDVGTKRFRLVPVDKPEVSLQIVDLRDDLIRRRLQANPALVAEPGDTVPEWLVKLCVRPLHLKMLESALQIGTDGRDMLSVFSRVGLYESYVRSSMEWDAGRGGTFLSHPGDRRLLYESIAVEMLNTGQTEVSEALIVNAMVRSPFGPDASNVHDLAQDVCNGVLFRVSSAGVTWDHKTYGEYLAACYIARLVREDPGEFGMIWFGRDERSFLVEMLTDDADVDRLLEWLSSFERYEARQFAAFILGGFPRGRLSESSLEKLWSVAEWCGPGPNDLLTRINCVNTLGFLGETPVVGDLCSIVASYMRLRQITVTGERPHSRREYPVTDLDLLCGLYGLPAVRLHVKESIDALSVVGDSALIPFVSLLEADDDEGVVGEARDCIRRLGEVEQPA